MILTCPECSTSYRAKDDAIGPNGRTVRCAKCSATWFVPAADVELATPDAMQLEDMTRESQATPTGSLFDMNETDKTGEGSADFGTEAAMAGPGADVLMRDKADAAKRKARARTIWLIWLIPLLLMSAMVLTLFFARQTIAERFPGTVPFYNALGIEVSVNGLKVESPTVKTVDINGETTLIIDGAVKNIGKKRQNLPPLLLSLHSPAGDEVAVWQVEFEKSLLRPNERLEFTSEYPNPPLDSVKLRYRLAE